MQCRAFKEERQIMNARIAAAIPETDKFAYALKTDNQKFAFLHGGGIFTTT